MVISRESDSAGSPCSLTISRSASLTPKSRYVYHTPASPGRLAQQAEPMHLGRISTAPGQCAGPADRAPGLVPSQRPPHGDQPGGRPADQDAAEMLPAFW